MKMTNEMSEGFATYNFMYGIFRGKDETVLHHTKETVNPQMFSGRNDMERYGILTSLPFHSTIYSRMKV